MKKTITLTLLLGIGCATAFAQQQTVKLSLKERMKTLKSLMVASDHSNAKTTAVMQRLTSYAEYDMSAGMQLTDSAIYKYDFGRGSAFDFDFLSFEEYYYYPSFSVGGGASNFIHCDSFKHMPGSGAGSKTYTATNKPARQVSYYGSFASRSTWTYNIADQITQSLEEMYDALTSSWTPGYRQSFAYNSAGKLVKDSAESYVGAVWALTGKSEYHYNASGLIDTVTMYNYNMGTWEPQARYSITYVSGMPAQSLGEMHNGITWENQEKIDMTYIGNQRTSEVYYEWNGTSWDLDSEEFRSLNSNNLPDSVFYRYYIGSLAGWDTTITKLTYNSFSNPVTIADYDASMTPDETTYFYYQDYDPAKVKDIVAAKSVTVYPNPAKDQLNITTKEMNAGQASYTITNTLGQSVIRGIENANGNKLTVDVQQLTPGMYWLHIQDAKGETYQAAFTK